MTSTSFSFKQFVVHQDRCAMKVSTDACILGAWVAEKCADHPPINVLDIGTGTGLLTLMLAQKMPTSKFIAVEIDKDAAQQATENVRQSPWGKNIEVLAEDVANFAKRNKLSFDLIICNPPFYTNSLKSNRDKINLARHAGAEFNKQKLIDSINILISSSGIAFILYPPSEVEELIQIASENGLKAEVKLTVFNQANGAIFRQIVCMSKQNLQAVTNEKLIIREGNNYTEAFESLLKAYYLKL